MQVTRFCHHASQKHGITTTTGAKLWSGREKRGDFHLTKCEENQEFARQLNCAVCEFMYLKVPSEVCRSNL